ncbi:hypothetical protein EDB89DRAFT_1911169 [Lactarius sanguifluus]|nr:hypothetical protein EDB89DRAFT_1911169 [Lactarius sanguifluus]
MPPRACRIRASAPGPAMGPMPPPPAPPPAVQQHSFIPPSQPPPFQPLHAGGDPVPGDNSQYHTASLDANAPPAYAHPHGVHPYGAHPLGAHPYGVHTYGAHPYGVHPYGTHPHGAQPYGMPPYGAPLAYPPPLPHFASYPGNAQLQPWGYGHYPTGQLPNPVPHPVATRPDEQAEVQDHAAIAPDVVVVGRDVHTATSTREGRDKSMAVQQKKNYPNKEVSEGVVFIVVVDWGRLAIVVFGRCHPFAVSPVVVPHSRLLPPPTVDHDDDGDDSVVPLSCTIAYFRTTTTVAATNSPPGGTRANPATLLTTTQTPVTTKRGHFTDAATRRIHDDDDDCWPQRQRGKDDDNSGRKQARTTSTMTQQTTMSNEYEYASTRTRVLETGTRTASTSFYRRKLASTRADEYSCQRVRVEYESLFGKFRRVLILAIWRFRVEVDREVRQTFAAQTDMTWPEFEAEVLEWFNAREDVRLGYRVSGDNRGWISLTCPSDWKVAIANVREKALAARTRAVTMEIKDVSTLNRPKIHGKGKGKGKRSCDDDIPPEATPEAKSQDNHLLNLQSHLLCNACSKSSGLRKYCWIEPARDGVEGGHIDIEHREMTNWAKLIEIKKATRHLRPNIMPYDHPPTKKPKAARAVPEVHIAVSITPTSGVGASQSSYVVSGSQVTRLGSSPGPSHATQVSNVVVHTEAPAPAPTENRSPSPPAYTSLDLLWDCYKQERVPFIYEILNLMDVEEPVPGLTYLDSHTDLFNFGYNDVLVMNSTHMRTGVVPERTWYSTYTATEGDTSSTGHSKYKTHLFYIETKECTVLGEQGIGEYKKSEIVTYQQLELFVLDESLLSGFGLGTENARRVHRFIRDRFFEPLGLMDTTAPREPPSAKVAAPTTPMTQLEDTAQHDDGVKGKAMAEETEIWLTIPGDVIEEEGATNIEEDKIDKHGSEEEEIDEIEEADEGSDIEIYKVQERSLPQPATLYVNSETIPTNAIKQKSPSYNVVYGDGTTEGRYFPGEPCRIIRKREWGDEKEKEGMKSRRKEAWYK